MIQNILSTTLFNNTGFDWLIAMAIFTISWIILKAFQTIGINQLKKLSNKTNATWDDALIEGLQGLGSVFYLVICIKVASIYLLLPTTVDRIIDIVFILGITWEVIEFLVQMTDYSINKMMPKKSATGGIKILIKIALWSFGLMLALSNLGIDITSLVAGLGIGGIAIALAVQNILSDIFSSFSILFDKPFTVGDFITIGKDSGTVEKIGVKTTRIRTLQGEELIVSNKELTTARVRNFGTMEQRRVAFTLGVIYETEKEKLEKIPEIIERILSREENAEYERCHFKSFGDFSLNYEIVYLVNSGDYNEYMDINQRINLNIFEEFGKAGIKFAYPTHVEYKK